MTEAVLAVRTVEFCIYDSSAAREAQREQAWENKCCCLITALMCAISCIVESIMPCLAWLACVCCCNCFRGRDEESSEFENETLVQRKIEAALIEMASNMNEETLKKCAAVFKRCVVAECDEVIEFSFENEGRTVKASAKEWEVSCLTTDQNSDISFRFQFATLDEKRAENFVFSAINDLLPENARVPELAESVKAVVSNVVGNRFLGFTLAKRAPSTVSSTPVISEGSRQAYKSMAEMAREEQEGRWKRRTNSLA